MAGLPGVVRKLTVDRVTGKGTATLTWLAPKNDGGSAVTGYRVRYRFALAQKWMRDASVTGTKVVISDLIAGCRYDVRVRAVNGPGAGDWVRTSVLAPTTGRMRLPSGDLRCLVQ